MKKTQISNLDEYINYVFPKCTEERMDKLYGLKIVRECFDTIIVDDVSYDIDENGNKIPESTPENVDLEIWLTQLRFPIILLELITDDVVCVDMVSLLDFKFYFKKSKSV